jgi:hypothetical protein
MTAKSGRTRLTISKGALRWTRMIYPVYLTNLFMKPPGNAPAATAGALRADPKSFGDSFGPPLNA